MLAKLLFTQPVHSLASSEARSFVELIARFGTFTMNGNSICRTSLASDLSNSIGLSCFWKHERFKPPENFGYAARFISIADFGIT